MNASRLLGPALVALLLSACNSAPKSLYPGADEARQRQSVAEAAAEAPGPDGTPAMVDSQATYLNLVQRMQQNGLWFASLAHIDALEKRWGVTPDSQRLRAAALRQTDQAAASESAYRKLIGTPLEAEGYRGMGLLAGARGDFPEAARLLQQAQQRTPTDALLLSDLGYALLRAGRIEEARVPLMQAAQLQPDNVQAQANLALYFEATGQPDKATALMDAHRMPEATRAAIRVAALPVGAAAAAPSVQPVPAASTPHRAPDDGSAPLVLKAAPWPGTRRTVTTIVRPIPIALPSQPPAASGDPP